MKKSIRTAAILLVTLLALTFTAIPSSAVNYTPQADRLNQMGLLRGTGNGYELDRESMRSEAATMLVRLLGKESEAQAGSYQHPFTDVPVWADQYVGYLYVHGLTKGTSPTTFSPDVKCDANMYEVFVLRALGYSEARGDFTYAGAPEFAVQLGLVDSSMAVKAPFLRDDMTAVAYSALFQKPQGDTGATLLDKLVSQGAVSPAAAETTLRFYQAYMEYLTATAAGQPKAPVKLEQNITMHLTLLGQTESETVKSLITIAKNGSSTIVKTEHEINTSDDVLQSTSYYVDGWVYTTDSDGSRYKYEGAAPAIEDALSANSEAPLYQILSIEKTAVSDGTRYSLTYTPGMFDSLAQSLLSDIGSDGEIVNIPFTSDAHLNTVLGPDGQLKVQELNVSLAADVSQGGTTLPLNFTMNAKLTVLESGSSVTVTLPADLNTYPEG